MRRDGPIEIVGRDINFRRGFEFSVRKRPGGGDGTPAPALQNFTLNFGALTTEARGGSPLATILGNTGGAVTTYTLIARNANTAADFTLPGTLGVVAEGVNAITPMPSATGDGNNLNRGPYAWDVTATNAGGSSTKILTLSIQTDAASIGNDVGADNYDYVVFSMTAAQFYNAPYNGRRILIQPGAVRGTSGIGFGSGWMLFPGQVTVEYAHPEIDSHIPCFTMSSNTNIKVVGLKFSGPTIAGGRITVSGTQNVVIEDVQTGFTVSDYNGATDGILLAGACDNVSIDGWISRYQRTGVNYDNCTNVTVNDIDLRHCARGGFTLGPGILAAGPTSRPQPANIVMTDVYIAEPDLLSPGDHCDGGQQLDDWKGYPVQNTIPGYTNVGGFYDGPATGVAQFVSLKDVVLGIASGNVGWTAYRPGRNGDTSSSENLQFENVIATGWNTEIMGIQSSKGDGYMRNVAVWVSNTGDDTNSPVGSKKNESADPGSLTVGCYAPANWPDSYEMTNVHIYGRINLGGASVGSISLAQSGVEQYTGNATNISADYVVNPRTYLEAISDAAWSAMDKATAMYHHKQAFRRLDGTGPVDAAGNWNVFTPPGGTTPKADSTTTKADSTLYKADAT